MELGDVGDPAAHAATWVEVCDVEKAQDRDVDAVDRAARLNDLRDLWPPGRGRGEGRQCAKDCAIGPHEHESDETVHVLRYI